jgi:hypothetical protein
VGGVVALFLALVKIWTMAASDPKDQRSALEQYPKGWIDILGSAGPKLDGWSRKPVPADKPLDPKSQWALDQATGYLVCQGDGGHEWLRLDQVVTDCIVHVEWRFIPVAGKKSYDSGVFVRSSSDGKIWHQAECGDASGGYLFGETLSSYEMKPFDLKGEMQANRVKPAGEWNTYELTCKGRSVTLWVNGGVTNQWNNCEVPRGYVGLEANGSRIEFRNVKFKVL